MMLIAQSYLNVQCYLSRTTFQPCHLHLSDLKSSHTSATSPRYASLVCDSLPLPDEDVEPLSPLPSFECDVGVLLDDFDEEGLEEDVSGGGGPGCSMSTFGLGASDLAWPDCSSPPYDVAANRFVMDVVGL